MTRTFPIVALLLLAACGRDLGTEPGPSVPSAPVEPIAVLEDARDRLAPGLEDPAAAAVLGQMLDRLATGGSWAPEALADSIRAALDRYDVELDGEEAQLDAIRLALDAATRASR